MDQVISGVGAVLVLIAFWLVQTERVGPHHRGYQAMNLVGAALLAAAALMRSGWAYVVLNVVWALVALWSLLGRRRAPRAPS